MGTFWGLDRQLQIKTVQSGGTSGFVVIIKTTSYKHAINFEPRGRPFDSVRAGHRARRPYGFSTPRG
jgi:hypothetical protein